MSNPRYRFTVIALITVITLFMSLIFPLRAFADDGVPPEEPGASEGEVLTGDTGTGTEEPAQQIDGIATEQTIEMQQPVDAATDEAVIEETATEPIAEEPAVTEIVVGDVSEAVEAMQEAGVVLADENGNLIPLATEVAADALLYPDPIGCPPPGIQPVTWGGTGAGCTSSYPSIQQAIDDVNVAVGWTIYIDPGTFSENVTINKSVVVQGSGVGVTIVHPGAASSLSLGCGAGSCASASNSVFYITADNVTIRDLTIDGDNPLVASGTVVNGADVNARNGIFGNDADNLVVEDTEVTNIYLRGIQVSNSSSVEIRNNIVENVDGSIYSISIFNYAGGGVIEGNTINETGDGIALNWSTGTQVLNNTISNMGTGIHTDNTQASDVISGNTISNGTSNSYGIFVFAPYAPVSVTDNTITNVDYGLTVSGNGWGDTLNTITFDNNEVTTNVVGAYVTTDVWGYFFSDVSASFTNNVFTGGDYGFYLESNGVGEYYPAGDYGCSGTGGDCVLNVTGSGNSITGQNLFAASIAAGQINWYDSSPAYYGTYNADLTGNWWGDASGPNDATAVPDGCAITLDNPTGLGGDVSECVLYDLWLVSNPFATSTGGGGGEGDPVVDDGEPVVKVPPFTFASGPLAFAGGPLNSAATEISCSDETSSMSTGEVEVVFAGLCGYEVALEAVTEDEIQSALEDGGKFLYGVNVILLKDGVPVDSLPIDAKITILFPQEGQALQWNGSWVEIDGKMVNGNYEVQAGSGIYILIDK